jgi:hypothetical protein
MQLATGRWASFDEAKAADEAALARRAVAA